jgi:hypothetical protein
MKLPPRKNIPFWVAVGLTSLGWLIYAYHLLAQFVLHVNILHLQMIPFVLVSVAFVLLFLSMTIPGLHFTGQAEPDRQQNQSPTIETEDQAAGPLVDTEKQTVAPLNEANEQAPVPSVGSSKPLQRFFSGRTRYYLIIAILCVVCIGVGYTPWADYQLAVLLFVGLPAGFWIIYKLSPEEKKPGK